ncbi:coiled-coil domain-containing protein 138-like [Glandiceps talaboti]
MYETETDSSSLRGLGSFYKGPTKHSSLETATLDLPTTSRSLQLTETPRSSPSRGSGASPSSGLNSDERKHYNRALRELYKIVQLSSKKIELSEQKLKRRLHQLQVSELELSGEIGDTRTLNEDELDTLRYDSEELAGVSPRLIEKYGRRHHRRKIEDEFSDATSEDRRDNRKQEKKIPVNEIHNELTSIHKKLQRESALLHEKEIQLQEREKAVEEMEQASKAEQTVLLRNAQQEVNRRWMILEEEHKAEIEQMEEILKTKIRESKRLKTSFDTMKQSNDTMKKKISDLQEQNKKLENQSNTMQSRLTNLQRKQELTDRHRDTENIPPLRSLTGGRKTLKELTESGKTQTAKQSKYPNAVYDVLTILLEWVSDVHLGHYGADLSIKSVDMLSSSGLTQERCLKVLPSLVEILHCLPASHSKIHLPCLQFIYWSLISIEQDTGSQKTALSSTYRRLGEELYKPTVVKFVETDRSPGGTVKTFSQPEKTKPGVFFKSTNLHIRFLSSLVILKTLTQVDYLANVFDSLKADLKTDYCKELFVHYQGTAVVLPFMKGSNKAMASNAVDVFLQMSMESGVLSPFLERCSTEIWFRTCSLLLRTPNLNVKMLEKLSIILQKLSKFKSNKRYFEVFSLSNIVQEMQRTLGADNPFLSLNLRSILFNLGAGKTSSATM